VLRRPCPVCGRVPLDPHHFTFTQPRALGRRVSDEFTASCIAPTTRRHGERGSRSIKAASGQAMMSTKS
jgi:hypothetical protein